jgi:hypothetical protein
MTSRTTRVLTASVASLLAAATLGCGILDQAKDLVGTAQVLSSFADRLGKAAELTYTAEYQVTGGSTVTLVHEPPNAAFIAAESRFISTPETLYFCNSEMGDLTCQKTANQAAAVGAADAGLVAGATGPGFITPEIALGLIAAAAFVPNAQVSQSEKTIADQPSLCATVTGLEAAATSGDTDAPKDFSVCVTDAGILASFSGTSISGEAASIELTKYEATADPAAFAPPPGTNVVDVDQIALPPTP